MWFEKLTGFKETSPENVRANLKIEGDAFISKANNRKFTFGKLDIVTLKELRKSTTQKEAFTAKIQVSEVIANVQKLHLLPENTNALFQAASQFNLLEMIGPTINPEQGIDRYERDNTQGPACAIACGAGTIYRNYFVEVNNQVGQSINNQIDCLDLVGKELNNEELGLWNMKNGYALVNQEGLLYLNKHLASFTDDQWERLKGKLKTGIQWNTEVTLNNSKQKVSQIYCSALPVAYSNIDPIYWESFARVVLEATYEATLFAALINLEKTNSNIVYLTLVGGGAFGNSQYWILESLEKALNKFKHVPLDVRIVSYGQSNKGIQTLINDLD